MIVAVPFNMFVWTCINVGKVRVLGAEATARADYALNDRHHLLLTGNYSYQQAEDRTNDQSPYYGNQIAYVPRVSSRWANNQHYDDTLIDGYWDTGITAWHTFRWGNQSLEARFDLKNIFDRQYEIVRFYPMPGRSWQLSVKYQI